MRRRSLSLASLLLAAACGPPDPDPSPSPTASPTPNTCTGSPAAYATAVVDAWFPACSGGNIYNDPQKALGKEDAGGSGPLNFTGFVSLGFGGYVTVDLGGCIDDRPGPDLRVFQAVGGEPVSVYVSLSPDGPFTLVAARQDCGLRASPIRSYCDIDIASGGATRARYVKVEDGELYACPGDTVSEGADLDAVQALGVATAATPERPR
ncbi:MAG TPA: hypothetical protein VGB87_17620 [Vicinamibacteria bacterium]